MGGAANPYFHLSTTDFLAAISAGAQPLTILLKGKWLGPDKKGDVEKKTGADLTNASKAQTYVKNIKNGEFTKEKEKHSPIFKEFVVVIGEIKDDEEYMKIVAKFAQGESFTFEERIGYKPVGGTKASDDANAAPKPDPVEPAVTGPSRVQRR